MGRKAKSREAKTKPGDLARARARHLRRQSIQDAIIRARAGEVGVPVTLHQHNGEWCEWVLSPLTDDDAINNHGKVYLVNCGRNHLEIGIVVEKDGLKLYTYRGGYIHEPQLMLRAEATNEAASRWAW